LINQKKDTDYAKTLVTNLVIGFSGGSTFMSHWLTKTKTKRYTLTRKKNYIL